MGYFIGIEDLAANAAIELLKVEKPVDFISYRQLEEYGKAAVEYLKSKGKKAVLVLSRQGTQSMLQAYPEYFMEQEDQGISGIRVRPGITREQLTKKFRGYLPLDVLLAFINACCIQVLFDIGKREGDECFKDSDSCIVYCGDAVDVCVDGGPVNA